MRSARILIFIILSLALANAQNIDSLKNVLKNAKHDTTRCIILSLLAEVSSDKEWPKYNEDLLKLTENKLITANPTSSEYKIFKRSFASALNNVGYLAVQNGDILKAKDYYYKSLNVYESISNLQGIAHLNNNIGHLYKLQGDIPKALEHYTKCLEILQKENDKKGMGYTLMGIGDIFKEQGDTSKALEYYEMSLKVREEIDDIKGIAHSLNNIGSIYSKRLNYLKALEFYNKSLKIQESNGDKKGLASSLNNIGLIYKRIGNLAEALDYYGRALKIQNEVGNKSGIPTPLNNIALIYIELNNYSKALEYAIKSMEVSKELGFPSQIKDAAQSLSTIYRSTGKYKLALENYELYIQMRDSINNIETQKASIKQQTQYEYDKKKAVEDEKHSAELKVQEEKAQADKKRQNIIIGSVSVVLILVAFFSILLFNRFKTTQKQKEIIEVKEKETQQQKHVIEEKQKEILDSINYAKRIQYTLLAHDQFLKDNLPEHFTYFNPKDIVSGDFYWATKNNDKFYLAVCDSTGHGVPGAFMSLLNIGFLSEAINEKGIEKPNEVFDYVRMKLTDTISKEGQKDGFDGILVCFDQKDRSITYAAANNAPILVKAGEISELVEAPADRMPVGVGERKENFSLNTIDAKQGDMLYLYTDGFADQFGGPKGKKYKYKQLNGLLLAINGLSVKDQQFKLLEAFVNWRGDLEQVDDVCVIGIRI